MVMQLFHGTDCECLIGISLRCEGIQELPGKISGYYQKKLTYQGHSIEKNLVRETIHG